MLPGNRTLTRKRLPGNFSPSGLISILPSGRPTRQYSIYPIWPSRPAVAHFAWPSLSRGSRYELHTRDARRISNIGCRMPVTRKKSNGKGRCSERVWDTRNSCSSVCLVGSRPLTLSRLFLGDLSALSSSFRKTNCNCLFAALHFTAFTGLKRAMFSATHGAGDQLTRGFAIFASA
jgi:hypothetical protein